MSCDYSRFKDHVRKYRDLPSPGYTEVSGVLFQDNAEDRAHSQRFCSHRSEVECRHWYFFKFPRWY